MFTKLYIFILIFGCFLTLDAQIKNEFFEFEGNKNISYYRILGGERSVAKFYVIFNQSPQYEKEVKKCLKRKDYKMFFTLTIPSEIKSKQKQEELFLAFVLQIVNSTKLIDSEMYVISDKDYMDLYERARQQNEGTYSYGKLNEINQAYIGKLPKEICDIINK